MDIHVFVGVNRFRILLGQRSFFLGCCCIVYVHYVYLYECPLSQSFLGVFSLNSFSTSMYVHYTLRGVLPFDQLYSEVKIMISEDDQDDRGKYR